ncbi:MAG: response regulator transcription factor [Anaerolineales bacterium]|nr:response regulator transcription factor [Anaerolineales bacterium]
MPEIRVLIADDHAILRDGIRSLLEIQPEIRVVGEAANGREALEKARLLLPDVVLMDVAMPEMNGLEATRQIKALNPQIQILILTQHDDREYVEPLLQAGASGYVLKRSGGREVITAIRQVYESGAYLEPSIARQVIEGFTQKEARAEDPLEKLTPRERQVFQLLVSGKSNKEIARELRISAKTISVHRSNLMAKLNVHNSIELVHFAAQHRLLEAD